MAKRIKIIFVGIGIIILIALIVFSFPFYFENKKIKKLAENYPDGQKLFEQFKVEQRKLFDFNLSNDIEAKTNIAIIKNLLGDKDGALTDYFSVFKKEPDNSLVLNNIAHIYQDKGDWLKAEKYFKELISKNPKFVPGYRSLGYLYLYRFQGKETEIEEIFEKGLAETNRHPDLLSWLAFYYQEKEEEEKALKYYQELLEKYPENAKKN